MEGLASWLNESIAAATNVSHDESLSAETFTSISHALDTSFGSKRQAVMSEQLSLREFVDHHQRHS